MCRRRRPPRMLLLQRAPLQWNVVAGAGVAVVDVVNIFLVVHIWWSHLHHATCITIPLVGAIWIASNGQAACGTMLWIFIANTTVSRGRPC